MLDISSFILFCATVLAIRFAWLARQSSRKNSTDVPRLPLPGDMESIWGHERVVFTNEPGKAFRKWMGEVGSTFRIKAAFGAPEILVLGDTEGISHILHRKIYDYHHSELVRPRVARLLGKGLGWIEGKEEHQRMKRLTSPGLSANNLRAVSPHVMEAASTVINELIDHVHTAGDCARVSLTDWTGKAILNIIGRVAFLHDFQGGNSDEAQQILAARKVGASPVARYSGFLTLMLLRRFTFLNYLPIAAISGQGLARRTVQSGVAAELIRRNSGLASKDENDLLSRILVASNEEKITDEELYAHISTFMIAGFESSTITLAFTAWELARHPQIQEKLRQEIGGLSGELSYDVLHSKMPYLDAVLKETLRLYPGLPYMERIATVPDVIPLKRPIQLSDGTTLKQLRVDAGQ
ncbi:hypothetical protein V5O48_018182, partial [Marasmius crinis-equi]